MLQQNCHEKPLVIQHIGRNNAKEIVPVARHRVALDDFKPGVDEILEAAAALAGMTADPDITQHVDTATDRLFQDTGCFERLDPPPAGSCRSACAFGDLGVAECRIGLKLREDSAIDGIDLITLVHRNAPEWNVMPVQCGIMCEFERILRAA